MKWSSFVHAFPEYGVLWHSLEFRSVEVPPEILSSFVRGAHIPEGSLDASRCEPLVRSGFALEEDRPDPCLAKLREVTRLRKEVQSLYLILTTRCNLACRYCLYGSAQSGSLKGLTGHMDLDTALRAIDMYAEATDGNDRLRPDYWEEMTFYGGEPLLNQGVLAESLRYIRRMQAQGRLWQGMTFVLNTNGTLLTPPILELLQAEGVRIHVSIDGPEEVHDRVRFLHSGKGSHAKVMEGLALMFSMGVDFIPLLTITQANLDILDTYVAQLCAEFGIKRYGLNLLMHTHGAVDPDYGERAAEAMLKTHDAAASYGAIDQMYEAACGIFDQGVIAGQSCGGGRKLVVFPQGTIHACQALEASGTTTIGRLPHFEADSPLRLEWLGRNRFDNPACLACPAVGGCGGGCGASSYNAGEGIRGIDPNHCSWMKAVFRRWLDSRQGRKQI